MKELIRTGERIVPEKIESVEDYIIYLKHLFAYEYSRKAIPGNGQVLELGCGEGYGTALLSRSAGSIIGLDVNRAVVERASEKYSGANCSFDIYDGVSLPYKDNTFDALVSFQTIEHIPNDKNFISEAYRVLKAGGIFILTTPNRAYRLGPGQKPWNTYHVREYSANELCDLLKTSFSSVKLMGVQGCDRVQEIEKRRVRKYRILATYDIFNVRGIVPGWIKAPILALGGKKQSQKECQDSKKEYSLNDFYIIEQDIDNCLDLLSVCAK